MGYVGNFPNVNLINIVTIKHMLQIIVPFLRARRVAMAMQVRAAPQQVAGGDVQQEEEENFGPQPVARLEVRTWRM